LKKFVIFGALTALIMLSRPAAQAQDADEVANLRKENELLKKQNEQLKREIELLKKGTKAQPDRKAATKDLELLKGTWNIDSMEWGGKGMPKDLMTGYKFVFDGNKLTWEGALGIHSKSGKITAIGDGVYPCEFKLDPGQDPKQIDVTMKLQKGERTLLGIYKIDGDTLKICYFTTSTGRRPIEFASKEGVRTSLIVLTRAKK
jgi:uncharacterized protein (TIGR03067 family)